MKISDLMTSHVRTVGANTKYRQLWEAIFKKRINSVPVVDNKKHLLGIVTRDDLLTALYPNEKEFIDAVSTGAAYEISEEKVKELGDLTAKDVMTRRIIFTRDTTPVMRALSRMIARRVHQLPVLDENDRLIGLVTRGDIFNALFKKQLAKNKSKR
jgi:CBS domain-containing membrane protein